MRSVPEKILVVDDLPDNIILIQLLLEEEGYQIETASSGHACLQKVYRSIPDLILLDVMMPGMDGYEVTRRLKADTSLPFLPILLVTASDRPSAAFGLDTGADEFIRKPIEAEELLARVRSLLRLKHSIDERDLIARQRQDFVSRLAHDLRTPMVAADRVLDLMAQGALGEMPEVMADAVRTLARSNSNLLELVNMLLEVYRYEAGSKRLHFRPVDLVELIDHVSAELSALATQKDLRLSVVHKGPIPHVIGDRLELRRVLTNLLGNALKFTDAGEITITVTAVHSDSCKVQMAISDTGPGIPKEEQTFLFQRFAQGKHNKGGSGLGLHLTRQIVEAHQGTLELDSEVGRGSTFTVSLPAVVSG